MRVYTQTFFLLITIALYNQGVSQTTNSNLLKQPGLMYLLGEPEIDVSLQDKSSYDIPRLFTFKNNFNTGEKSSAYAFINKDNKLYLSCAPNISCPTCVGCKCVKYFSGPFPILQDMDLSKTTGIAITSIGVERYDTSMVQIILNNDQMKITTAIFKIFNDKCTQISISNITLQSSKADQSINGMTAIDSNRVLVYGKKGLLRIITINGESREENHDVDSTENLICGGELFAGSDDGSIYHVGEKNPVAELGVPLITISSSGAGSQNGLIAEHTKNGWEIFNTTQTSPRYLTFLTTAKGREVCVVNDTFGLSQIVLHNRPTVLAVDSPQTLASSLNGSPFNFQSDTLKASFSVSDPEGNIDPPGILLHTKGTIKPNIISLINSLERPSYMSRKLADNEFSIVFTSDSVIFSASCTESQCYWENTLICNQGSDKPYSKSIAWSNSDTLFIFVGNDTLRITNDIHVSSRTVKFHTPFDVHNTVSKTVSLLQHGSALQNYQKDFSFQIYDLNGHRIDAQPFTHKMPSGSYILKLTQRGNTVVQSFVISR